MRDEDNLPRFESRYKVLHRIADGRRGSVYQVFDSHLQRSLAVKILDRPSEEQTHAARIFSRIRSPYIVSILDEREHEGQRSLWMEYVGGKNLQQIMANSRCRMHWLRVANIGLQLCEALHCVHQNGLVYRNIALENVILVSQSTLTAREIVKLCGFGGAVPVTDARTEQGYGSVVYASPEVLGKQRHDQASDVFALGVLLYILLTDEHPFSEPQKMLSEEVTAPSAIDAGISNALDAVLLKALARSSRARWSNASEFARALRGAIAGIDVPPGVHVALPQALSQHSRGQPIGRRPEFLYVLLAMPLVLVLFVYYGVGEFSFGDAFSLGLLFFILALLRR